MLIFLLDYLALNSSVKELFAASLKKLIICLSWWVKCCFKYPYFLSENLIIHMNLSQLFIFLLQSFNLFMHIINLSTILLTLIVQFICLFNFNPQFLWHIRVVPCQLIKHLLDFVVFTLKSVSTFCCSIKIKSESIYLCGHFVILFK